MVETKKARKSGPIKKQKRYKPAAFEEYVESLKKELERYEKFRYLYDYFKRLKTQNLYAAEIRTLAIEKLEKEGLSSIEISRIICRSHSTVSIAKFHRKPDTIARDQVAEKWEEWIEQGVYPKTYYDLEPNYLSKNCIKKVTRFTLEKLI